MNVSILIPTKNRPDFLLRLLKYYFISNFKGVILVGDSSDDELFSINEQNIVKYKEYGLAIEHYYDCAITADKMIALLSKKVKTDYSAMLADDDIILTESISACIDFMDNNADYSAVHGKASLIGVDNGKCVAYGKVTSLTSYPLPVIKSDISVDRVEEYFNNILNINMSVVRSQINIDAFNEINRLTDYYSSATFGELIHASVVCSRGKVGEIDNNYLIRQFHTDQAYHKINTIDWISDIGWCDAYDTLESVINKEVTACDDVKIDNLDGRIYAVLYNWKKVVLTSIISNANNSHSTSYVFLSNYFNRILIIKNIIMYLKLLTLSLSNLRIKDISSEYSDIKQYITIIKNK